MNMTESRVYVAVLWGRGEVVRAVRHRVRISFIDYYVGPPWDIHRGYGGWCEGDFGDFCEEWNRRSMAHEN